MFNFAKNLYSDIRIEDRFVTNIMFLNGVLETSKETVEKKAFLRVYDGKMWYYSSTCDVEHIQQELDSLASAAKPNKSVLTDPVVSLFQANVDEKYVFVQNSVRNVAFDTKKQKLEKSMSYLSGEHLTFSQAVYVDRNSRYEFYSSKGANVKYDYQTCGMRVAAMFALGESKVQHFADKGGSSFEEVDVTEKAVKDMVAESENFIAKAKPCKQGSFPVLMSNVTAGVFAHESFGHKSEADFMLGDETMAKEWQLGKKVASDLLTICESGNHLGSGYTPYDDEGTKCSLTYLIKDGVLSGRLHSAQTAAFLHEKPTGNARALNCNFEPIVRMTNTYILGGDSTVEDLIKGIKFGYYVKTIKHGSEMSTFTIAPEIAYEIVDGKLGDPVRIGVLTGNVFETLSLIDGVANDFELLSFVGGGCGKMEQYPLPVGLGGPHVRVSSVNVQ